MGVYMHVMSCNDKMRFQLVVVHYYLLSVRVVAVLPLLEWSTTRIGETVMQY